MYNLNPAICPPLNAKHLIDITATYGNGPNLSLSQLTLANFLAHLERYLFKR